MSILENDTHLSFPSNTVVSASAGSGKTYTLAQRYVQFLLSDRIPNSGLRNILAMTFTNLAAKEMRQRVLRYLKALSLGRERELVEMGELVSCDRAVLRQRAGVMVDHILDQYSDFQVKTIDSFMVSVFKSSALDSGFTPDVEILLTNDTLIDEAFDRYSREMSLHPGRTGLLEELIVLLSQTREGKRRFLWDPYSYITGEVKELYEMLSSRPEEPVLEDVRHEIQAIKDRIKDVVTQLDDLLKRLDLSAGRYVQKDFDDLRNGNVDAVAGRSIKDKLVGKLSFTAQRAYAGHKTEIEGMFSEYNDLIARYRICSSLMYYQPHLKAVLEIREVLHDIKRRRRQLFIHDVNKTIVGMVKEERVPEIYFHLGETIYHFLIDEFQDTAPIQWANLRPLIENSLAQPGSSLFTVGDMKQSIYGFRFADWTIMKRMIGKNEFPSANHELRELGTNWRSYERIIDFTSEVFQRIIPATEYAGAASESGLDRVAQNVREDFRGRGYVEVAMFPGDDSQAPEEKKLLEVIADCQARGHRLRDMAVLTPKNENVISVSSWLNRAGIPFVSHSSLDIRTRKITGEIIALLQFLDSPIDDHAFATFLLSDLFQTVLKYQGSPVTGTDLRSLIFSSYRERRSPLYKIVQEEYVGIWERYFAEPYRTVGYLPLYDLLSDVYKVFEVFQVSPENEGTLVKLLDVVKLFEESGDNSIKEFLRFALDEGDVSGWEMDVPVDDNAVTLMTVHKAKGLDFPVVAVLLYDTARRSKEYYVDESGPGIKLLHIPRKFNEKVDYLDTIYRRERLKDDVDELNKLYVSLTRAKEEMYVLGVYKKERKDPTKLLPDRGFPAGPKPAVTEKPHEVKRLLSPFHHDRMRRHEPIMAAGLGLLETKRGDLIHAVLSHIEFVRDDVDKQINEALRKAAQSVGHHNVLNEAEAVVKAFLVDRKTGDLFAAKEGRAVLREQEFVSSSGLLYRMDRVIVDPDAVAVIDFKTGGNEREEDYRMQVKSYMNLVREIFAGKSVSGVIAYVDRRELVFLS